MQVNGELRLAGVLLALLISPMALVWPRSSARLLVPKRTRPAVARHPQLWTWLIAVLLASWSALGATAWLLGAPAAGGLLHPTPALASLYGVFGGVTLVAFTRALALVGREWAVTYAARSGAQVHLPDGAGPARPALRMAAKRRAVARADGPYAEPSEALRAWGFRVSRPAGEWARGFAPAAFMSGQLVVGPSVWPWAAAGDLDGRPVLFAQQRGQVRNGTGLTTTRTRTVCAVQMVGAHLPTVVVSGREDIPPTRRATSIDLELDTFNRSLWAWGPDPRGCHDVLHPRTMALILRGLPDGAAVRFHGDCVAVYSDEPVLATDLHLYLDLVKRLADLLPTYLVQRT